MTFRKTIEFKRKVKKKKHLHKINVFYQTEYCRTQKKDIRRRATGIQHDDNSQQVVTLIK